mgnify:CR=1 FL=1
MAGGRPTKFTQETIDKLEAAYLMGCTDIEACLYADVSTTALYNYQEKNPEFVERKQRLKSNPVVMAKGVVLNALEANDINTAHKVIERKEGTKIRQEVTGKDGGPVGVIASHMTAEEATDLYRSIIDD